MKKEVLEEINRFRELVSLKPMNIINESFLPAAFLKKIGLEAIEQEIEAFIKNEAKELAIQEIKKGVPATSLRGGTQAAKAVEKESVEKVVAQIEKESGKALTSAQKLSIEQEIRLSLVEEMKLAGAEFARVGAEVAEQAGKKSTKKSTWQAIKEHIKRNRGKYALGAAALALAAYAYFYPGEKPEEEEEPTPTPTPSRYTDCPDFPFIKFCKNDKIREIQKCIGAKVDGTYGPETEGKLKEKGYPTTITKEVFDEIIKKCGGGRENESGNTNLQTYYSPDDI
jgi:hypothetical protein